MAEESAPSEAEEASPLSVPLPLQAGVESREESDKVYKNDLTNEDGPPAAAAAAESPAEPSSSDQPTSDEPHLNPKMKGAERRPVFSKASSFARDDPGKSNPPSRSSNLLASSTLRHMTRVSKRAALATKKQIWDSNEITIVAAQSAVDQWEQGYRALRGLLLTSVRSAEGLYGAAKTGAAGLEHGLLLPVRDWVLLPAFGGAERLASETSQFLHSDQVDQVAQTSLQLVRQVPFVGESVLAPAMCMSADAMKQAWAIAQYPIPSPNQVRDSVGFVMAGTKWLIRTTSREVILYIQQADANITRTLCHTQWKVLGSGPYATLDDQNKEDVIAHLCERYLELRGNAVARYELAAHIRAHNRPLYDDLIFQDLLRERGGEITKDDEWLSTSPVYTQSDQGESTGMFLLPTSGSAHSDEHGIDNVDAFDRGDFLTHNVHEDVVPLWFYLPNENGERPGRDVPWVQFTDTEQKRLERKYRSLLKTTRIAPAKPTFVSNVEVSFDMESLETQSLNQESHIGDGFDEPYPTVSKRYSPSTDNDVLVDERRHAVLFTRTCSRCRQNLKRSSESLILDSTRSEKVCPACAEEISDIPWIEAPLLPPPISMISRPTMWRYYGPGDEVRRATWLLDTKKHGLQPYGEDDQAVLEDAYLFLKWSIGEGLTKDNNTTLLTVQVRSPNGEEDQLIQFSSLNQVTAIGKGLGGAIALFKRRVYRGVCTSPYQGKVEQLIGKAKDRVTDVISRQKVDVLEGPNSGQVKIIAKKRRKNPKPLWPVGLSDGLKNKLSLDIEIKLSDDENSITRDDEGDSDSDDASSVGDSEASLEDESEPQLSPRMSLAFPFRDDEKEAEVVEDTINEDNISHLVLVVHGIGEMLRSMDLFGLAKIPTIVECCGFLRKNHQDVLKARLTNIDTPTTDADNTAASLTGRVEYLPVEWHEAFSLYSQRRNFEGAPTLESKNVTMNDVSLRTIPQLRQFANDTMMDVLYFMSPQHHDTMVDIVVREMNFVVSKFRKLTGFTGDVSIMGHSLGSIISWDILSHQNIGSIDLPQAQMAQPLSEESSLGAETPEETIVDAEINFRQGGPEHTPLFAGPIEPRYPQINFQVDNCFMLGSPIAVFLMIRNEQRPLPDDLSLPGCPRVFNIFHPYDPVAYRIEPLIDPRNAEVEPKIMIHWHGGYRFQYQTRRLWKKLVDQTRETQKTVIEGLETSIAALGLLDNNSSNLDEETVSEATVQDNWAHTVNAGNINQGNRIDYMLQEKEIENATEYVSALAAHSCYWLEKDLSLFVARQLCLRAIEKAAGDADGTFRRMNSTEWSTT